MGSVATKPKVLLLGEIENTAARAEYETLYGLAELVTTTATCRDEFLAECYAGTHEGVFVIFRTFASLTITGRFDEELLNALPKSVKFVCHNGAGYDQISIPACNARHVQVSHTPIAPAPSTADTAVFLILGCLRNYPASLTSIREGKWRGCPPPPLGHDPYGKTLGIIGMGTIGKNLARKMQVFGMRILYHCRNRLDFTEETKESWEYASLGDLLAKSHVVSLNTPLNPQTHHMISYKELAMFRPGAILINTARGAVIDENALVEALESGRLASAGLDVFEDEPAVHERLLANNRLLLLPHMGTWTEETQEAMERSVIDNVRSVLLGGELVNRVKEQTDEVVDGWSTSHWRWAAIKRKYSTAI